VECLGFGGTAELTLRLPHRDASLADMRGRRTSLLHGGPKYQFAIRPQQIVTLRFRTDSAVPDPEPRVTWDDLVPEPKRAALHEYTTAKGHPPRGN
jgi:hypothetical protein